MSKILMIFLFALRATYGETHTLTLKQTLSRAISQNPDVALLQLDELKAGLTSRLGSSAIHPRVTLNSSPAYTKGIPLGIDGTPPSLFQARVSQSLLNRQGAYAAQAAKENTRVAAFATAWKQDEVAYRTASLFLDASRGERLTQTASRQIDNLKRVTQTVNSRVQEGRELPIELKRTKLELAKATQRLELLVDDQDYAERALAVVLGYPATDRVLAAELTAKEALTPATIPSDEEASVALALAASSEMKRLQSAMQASALEVKSQRAARLPTLDLQAEYSVLSRFNNYDEFFRKFQRNNVQAGVLLQLALFNGREVSSAVGRAQADEARVHIEAGAARNRIAFEVHQSYREIHRAETAREISQSDLEVSRDSLSIVLAQMGEGRASLRQVEEARYLENEKWIAFYDAQFAVEKARLNLQRQTGELVASVR